MLKPFKDKNYAYLTYPKLTVVVTAGIPGRATAMAASWHTYLSLDPPLYGVSIAPKRFTHKLITEHKEFGVNFLPFELSKLIWDVGSVSGAKIDKFEKFNIKTFNGEKIRAPLIADSIVVLECKVTDTVRTG
ncbi:MAG: flavin reductase family protein, partial [Candidatus Korarchaeota archaeon]|nr:flavin reductase family protein [Thermoproteota archaeon]